MAKPGLAKHLILVFFLLGFCLSSPAQASSSLAPKGTAERKFQRGLINIAFAPVEISYALADKDLGVKRENFPPSWLTNGILRGSYFAVVRAFTGIYDIVTAPFPRPESREPFLRHREFALQHLGLMKDESS